MGSNWLASLEVPTTGKRIGFANLEQLFAYILDLSETIHIAEPEDGEAARDLPALP
jgi:hypothetical protein